MISAFKAGKSTHEKSAPESNFPSNASKNLFLLIRKILDVEATLAAKSGAKSGIFVL